MGEEDIFDKIKEWIAKRSFRVFLWASDLTEDQYLKQLKKDLELNENCTNTL